MKSASILFFVVFQVLAYCHLTLSQSPWKLQFDFNGYKRQNKDFLMKSCPTEIKKNVAQTGNSLHNTSELHNYNECLSHAYTRIQ